MLVVGRINCLFLNFMCGILTEVWFFGIVGKKLRERSWIMRKNELFFVQQVIMKMQSVLSGAGLFFAFADFSKLDRKLYSLI